MTTEWIDVSDVTPRIAYTATASQTLFTVPFVFFEDEDLLVYQNTVLLTLATHYTVSGAEDEDGGTVTLLTGATAGDDVMIVRDVAIVQTTHIAPSGPLDIAAVNVQFSKLIAIDQQLDDKIDRSIHFPDSDSTISAELASVATRGNKLLGFDADGELIYPSGPTFVGDTATGVAIVDSRATAAVTTFDVSVNVVRTGGLVTAGDGGGAEYIRGLVGDPGAFQDGGGVYWKLASVAGAVVVMDTRVSAAAARYAANVNIVITGGYTTAGDGGGAIYERGIISSPGAFQDAEGDYWGLDLSAGIVLASWFGAVGDDTTDDYTALQAGITAAQAAGVEFHLNPGKKYYVSGADLTITIPSGCLNFHFCGNGSQIRTNPAQARQALVVDHATAVTRADQNRKVLISGLTIRQYQDANAIYGISVIGSPHVTIRDCSFLGGADDATVPYGNYACIKFAQSDTANPDTGSFWCRVENCDCIGGSTNIPCFIFFEGGSNATIIQGNSISACEKGVWLHRAAVGANDNAATIANGIRILHNDFEGCVHGVYVSGTSTFSRLDGLIVAHNRIESTGTVFFNYLLDVASFAPPVIGPNYLSSADWGQYISSASNLAVDVMDQFVGTVTLNPNNFAAGVSAAIGTATVIGAQTGDHVSIEVTGDLQGCVVGGYVSSANTVTIRLSNPTSGAIDLPSMRWIARVRPQF
jgi:hypothetical protein